jgi:uncharacterized membrane protein
MSIELTALISVCGTAIGAVLGIASFRRTAQRDMQSQAMTKAKNDSIVMTELKHIHDGVDEIKLAQGLHGQKIDMLSERVTRIEESVKQAHKRINKLEGNTP